MNLIFLKYYFENKLFLQNPPMHMKNFIKFCHDRGLDIDKPKLENFEKQCLFYPIFRVTGIKNVHSGEYSSLYFDEYSKDDFIS